MPGRATSGALCCAVALSGAAGAAEWRAEPQFSLSANVDSNRRLLADGERSGAAQLSGSLSLARRTETSELSFQPRVDVRRYEGVDEALGSNDAGADIGWRRQSERLATRLTATAREDSTLTSELADTGIVEGRARRQTLSAAGDTQWTFGERTSLQFGASFMNIDFDDAAGTGLTPYRYPAAFLGLSRETTDRSRFTLTASAGRLEVPSTDVRVGNTALRASWATDLTERFSVELSGGINRVENSLSSDQGTVFGLGGTWNHPRSSLQFSLARDVEPSALGRMMNVDSVSGSWRWQTGERSWFSLALRHLRRADLLFGVFPERRDYSTAQAAFNWRLDDDWTLEFRGGGARQHYDLVDYEATGARLDLLITWSPRRISLAR